jgi:hypothetical protein
MYWHPSGVLVNSPKKWDGAVPSYVLACQIVTTERRLDAPIVLDGVTCKRPQGLRDPGLDLDHIEQVLILLRQLLEVRLDKSAYSQPDLHFTIDVLRILQVFESNRGRHETDLSASSAIEPFDLPHEERMTDIT